MVRRTASSMASSRVMAAPASRHPASSWRGCCFTLSGLGVKARTPARRAAAPAGVRSSGKKLLRGDREARRAVGAAIAFEAGAVVDRQQAAMDQVAVDARARGQVHLGGANAAFDAALDHHF